MKLQEGFLLQKIAGSYVIVPLGDKLKQYKGLFKINNEAAFIYENLAADVDKQSIIAKFAEFYQIGLEESEQIYNDFLAQLNNLGIACIEDEI